MSARTPTIRSLRASAVRRRRAALDRRRAADDSGAMLARTTRERPLLLLAEDDEDLREALLELLDQEGYRTMTAPDGLAALEHARGERPAAAVVDVNLPGAGGRTVAEELLRRDPGIRVVLISGEHGAVAPRGAAMLAKPFRFDRLLAALRKDEG